MEGAGGVHQFVEEFYRKRLRYRRFAFRFVRSDAVAEQLVDDCLVRLWERRGQIGAQTVEAYFYTSLKNTCLNYLRDRKRQREIERQIYDASYRLLAFDIASLESMDPTHIFRDDIQSILHRELERLPVTPRGLFLESRFSAITHEELGKKYGLPKYKVEREIRSVLERLRVALKDYLPAVLAAAAVLLLNG